MARRRSHALPFLLAALAAVGLLAGCSGGSSGGGAPTDVTSSRAPEATPSPAGYTTTSFAVPLSVTPESWASGPPTEEQANFMTWVSADDAHAVRFLVPVSLYEPGSSTDGPPPAPAQYLAYLRGLERSGATFTDVDDAVVGGRPATILTATTTESLDGSLGCQDEGLDAPDCYGLQADLVLRMAVMPVGDKTLLVWERIPADAAAEVQSADADAFESMLDTITFT